MLLIDTRLKIDTGRFGDIFAYLFCKIFLLDWIVEQKVLTKQVYANVSKLSRDVCLSSAQVQPELRLVGSTGLQ